MVWSAGVVATIAVIRLDMKRLAARRVGVSLTSWAALCLCAWPLAGMAYLVRRRTAQEGLTQAAWQLVGDQSFPLHVRQERLITLRQTGLIGESLFLNCLQMLEKQKQQ
jgi:hypothetical protein